MRVLEAAVYHTAMAETVETAKRSTAAARASQRRPYIGARRHTVVGYSSRPAMVTEFGKDATLRPRAVGQGKWRLRFWHPPVSMIRSSSEEETSYKHFEATFEPRTTPFPAGVVAKHDVSFPLVRGEIHSGQSNTLSERPVRTSKALCSEPTMASWTPTPRPSNTWSPGEWRRGSK